LEQSDSAISKGERAHEEIEIGDAAMSQHWKIYGIDKSVIVTILMIGSSLSISGIELCSVESNVVPKFPFFSSHQQLENIDQEEVSILDSLWSRFL
jgi:hypothetical protein